MSQRILSILILMGFVPFIQAGDWPQFRGPNSSAVGDATNLPVEFDKDKNVRWKAELPARGVSSPVIVDGIVYVTCSGGVNDERLHVLAFDVKTGKQLWHRKLLATGGTACHPKTCMAAPTPVADSSGVYALFATGDLAAFDPKGNLRWYRSLTGDYPSISNQVGMAASPILVDGKLIVPMDNSGDSFVAAIDTEHGKNLWKTSRDRDINWATPTTLYKDGQTQILLAGRSGLVAYDLSTGKEVWKLDDGSSIPSPTVTDGMLVMPAGQLVVAKVGPKGIQSEAWKTAKMQAGTASPLVYQDRVYVASSSGIVRCAELATGKILWNERVKGPFSASPIAADDKIFILNEEGTLTVMQAGDEPEILGTSETNEEGLATPAIADGALFLRGEKTLWCISKESRDR